MQENESENVASDEKVNDEENERNESALEQQRENDGEESLIEPDTVNVEVELEAGVELDPKENILAKQLTKEKEKEKENEFSQNLSTKCNSENSKSSSNDLLNSQKSVNDNEFDEMNEEHNEEVDEEDDIYVNSDDFLINELNEFDDLNGERVNGECEIADEVGDDTESDIEMIEAYDDREGCRSLVCDPSGIIVAEMVYRCMICANISESVNEAQKHYQIKHILCESDDLNVHNDSNNNNTNISCNSNRNTSRNLFTDFDIKCHSSNNGNSNQISTITFDVPSSLKQLQQQINPSLQQSPGSIRKRNGNDRVATGLHSNVTRNVQVNSHGSRGGFVTCTVCNITKFYASVQRRYGQFTCMGCAKFFGRFLLKPRKYYCPNLGSCPLDTSPRCKACLLLGCIQTYTIDQERMKIVNAYKPIKKAGPLEGAAASATSITIGQVSVKPILANECSNDYLNSEDKEEIVVNINPITSNFSSDTSTSSLLSSLKEVSPKIRLPPNDQHSSNSLTITNIRPNLTVKKVNGVSRNRNNSNSKVSGRKLAGCRTCEGCLAEDCGKCHYCLDKPKYGGPNTLKKKCIQKRCSIFEAVSRRSRTANYQSKTTAIKRKV